MTKGKSGAGLRSDGELVQAGADAFVFAPVREDAVGLLLPAVQSVREAPAPVPDTRGGHGDWIDILTMSPPPPTRATQSGGDDDGLPPTLDWGIDGDGPGDQGHGGWIDILSTGGGGTVAKGDEDGLPVTPVWDLG